LRETEPSSAQVRVDDPCRASDDEQEKDDDEEGAETGDVRHCRGCCDCSGDGVARCGW
jgi:hypothetical protein